MRMGTFGSFLVLTHSIDELSSSREVVRLFVPLATLSWLIRFTKRKLQIQIQISRTALIFNRILIFLGTLRLLILPPFSLFSLLYHKFEGIGKEGYALR